MIPAKASAPPDIEMAFTKPVVIKLPQVNGDTEDEGDERAEITGV
jgi:hypothetical protein